MPILAHIGPWLAVVFLVFLLAMVGLFWWGARRRPRRLRSTYEFDEDGRAYRVTADEELDT